MRAALVIAAKDLRQSIRDRSVILIAIVVPFGLSFILAQTLSGVTGESVTFEFGYVDQDGGELATAFRNEVLADLEDEGVIALTEADTVEQGRALAGDGDVGATLVVPAGFTESIMAGEPAAIQVFGNVDSSIATSVAESIAQNFLSQLRAVQLSIATVNALAGDPQNIAELAERAEQFSDPVAVQDVSASRRQLDAETYFAAGMAVFFLFFTVQIGVNGLLQERRTGTMRRLLAAPVSKAAVVGGKMLTAFVVGIVSMTALVLGTTFLIGAEWGDPLGVAVLVVAGVLAAIAIMSFAASFAGTPESAENSQIVIAMLLGMLGGSFFPVAQAGGVIEWVSLITPHAWFLNGLGELQAGGTVADIWIHALVILAIAAVAGVAALFRVGRMARP